MSKFILPKVNEEKVLNYNHFPTRFHAAVFRLWETVWAERMAVAFETTEENIIKAAEDMGLPPQKFIDRWEERGYITTIRNAWHLLPYEQLLKILDWSEEKLAITLKDDDFLQVKLGGMGANCFKPYCEPIHYVEPDDVQKKRLAEIKKISTDNFGNLFSGAEPFDFFKSVTSFDEKAVITDNTDDGLRLIYSFCGLYAGALDNDISISFPDYLLKMYQKSGVNAIWIPVILYQMVPFYFDESYSVGWEKRQERLRELIKLAAKYGMKVYLYLNEPRCMPAALFKKYPDWLGTGGKVAGTLCSSDPRTMEYLRYAVRTLCENVEGIGGFFTITASENATSCKCTPSQNCKRCKDYPVKNIYADIITAVSEESRKVDPEIKTIAWTWSWFSMMSQEEVAECISLLPKEVMVMTVSEEKKPFTINGVSDRISDYSMSIPGPSPLAEFIWNKAIETGHDVCAKVQINTTWECSPIPFLPVFDLVREHMIGLKKEKVKNIMLSWTLGGYPSVNNKVASECLKDPSEEKYDKLLKEEFGKDAHSVKQAAKTFSDAFREFPFHIDTLYKGPQNGGPSNLLFDEPTGFKATMTCYTYDDIESWRSAYPVDKFIEQFKKLSEKWGDGLKLIQNMEDCFFKQAAYAGYALFRSSYLQCRFVIERDNKNYPELIKIIKEEKEIAELMYDVMNRNYSFGFEASNHYYFNKGLIAEKIVNCDYLLKIYSDKE